MFEHRGHKHHQHHRHHHECHLRFKHGHHHHEHHQQRHHQHHQHHHDRHLRFKHGEHLWREMAAARGKNGETSSFHPTTIGTRSRHGIMIIYPLSYQLRLVSGLRQELSHVILWVAHCIKVIGSIPEGDQKVHKYTCFARSALCTGNLYDLYTLLYYIYTKYINRYLLALLLNCILAP